MRPDLEQPENEQQARGKAYKHHAAFILFLFAHGTHAFRIRAQVKPTLGTSKNSHETSFLPRCYHAPPALSAIYVAGYCKIIIKIRMHFLRMYLFV